LYRAAVKRRGHLGIPRCLFLSPEMRNEGGMLLVLRVLRMFACRHCRQSQATIKPSARESVRSVVGDCRHPVVQVVEMVWRACKWVVWQRRGRDVTPARFLLLDNRRITCLENGRYTSVKFCGNLPGVV
jgi:hypothetical protein